MAVEVLMSTCIGVKQKSLTRTATYGEKEATSKNDSSTLCNDSVSSQQQSVNEEHPAQRNAHPSISAPLSFECQCVLSSLMRQNNTVASAATCSRSLDSTFFSDTAITPSLPSIWNNVRSSIVSTIVSSIQTKIGFKQAMSESHKLEVDATMNKLLNTFSLDLLERSATSPLRYRQRQEIVTILQKRLADPTKHPPLRIWVSGGSMVAGTNALEHPWNFSYPGSRSNIGAFPAFLQALCDQLIGVDTVLVLNVATGGSTSDVGAVPLRYRLWSPSYRTGDRSGPDIILHAHQNNDFQNPASVIDGDVSDLVQEFIQAANKVYPCANDSDLPAVVLIDDHLGFSEMNDEFRSTEYHRMVAQLAGWYQIGAISYANAMRPLVQSHPTHVHPVLGSHRSIHPNIVFHSCVALFIAYNLVKNVVDVCSQEPYSQLNRDDASSFTQQLPLKSIPKLPIGWQNGTMVERWRNTTLDFERTCQELSSFNGTHPCSYYWITNSMMGCRTSRDVRIAMKDALVNSTGWVEEGNRVKKPRPGWVATSSDAKMTTRVTASAAPIRYMTMLSMLSYGAKWAGSTLQLTIRVIRKQVMNATNNSNTDEQEAAVHTVLGYHNDSTSIVIPNVFPIPAGGANIGDTVEVSYDMVNGRAFRIQGLMFCSIK